MSLPRAVVPGRMYMITRRCSERRFFLRPRPESNNAFVYCLIVAAKKYGIEVMFTATMSNHHHTGILDVKGTLPDFLAYFHKLFAKHQNALHGRWECMWAPEQTSAVELLDEAAFFEKMVYALVNPVADHIVEKVHHWPGVNSLAATIADKPLSASRPKTFFRPDGRMPETVSLSLHIPPELLGTSRVAFVARLKKMVSAAEKKASNERVLSGRTIVGRGIVRRQHWNESPHTREPRRLLNPRIASRDKWRRIEALGRDKEWLEDYRKARRQLTEGVDVTFPAGTFWLHRFAGVPCEPAGSS